MRSLVFILLSVMLSGCWNNGNMEVRGKILDEKTQVLIPNRKIIVHELVNSDENNSPTIIGEFRTDSLGQFNYQLRKSGVTYFYNFEIMGDSAYDVSNNKLGMTELNQKGKFLTFYMCKLTDLVIKIERRSRTSFQDTLFLSWQSDGKNGEGLYPYKILNFGTGGDIPLRWVGGNIKSIVKTKVFADKKVVVRWELFRHGRPTEFADTIFCRRGAENSISFKY